MESTRPPSADATLHTPQSSTSSTCTSSPALSFFSRGHSSRGSGSTSSLASSPITRDSFDLYASTKRLADVREDPSEREDENEPSADSRHYFLDEYGPGPSHMWFESPPQSPQQADWSLEDHDTWSTASSRKHESKRQKSVEPRSSVTNRISNRFPSLSKRWKSKSAAGPQLSIITHSNAAASRSGSASESQLISPALSAISKHESYLPPSPVRLSLEQNMTESSASPIIIEQRVEKKDDQDQGQATTPLLPPVFSQLSGKDSPIHSPLQSPTIAAATISPSSLTPTGTPVVPSLPSPPLSSKPSLASMGQRSRANTANLSTAEIPPMQMLDDRDDPWSQRLGHANFNIHPEPYTPANIDLDSYRELRANWDCARTNYTKHLARTREHYGTTSKVYLLTQEKWTSVDDRWKKQNDLMTAVLSPVISRISDGDTTMTGSGSLESSTVLEKPVTRVMVPQLDDSDGKFPDLGDEDIVGPMSVAPARAQSMQKSTSVPAWPNPSSRKRNFLKFLSDILGRSGGLRN